MHEMLKTASGNYAMGTTQTSEWFLLIQSSQVISPQATQKKTWRKSTKSSMKTDEVHFRGHWQVWPLI
jgi:hypothetical protein